MAKRRTQEDRVLEYLQSHVGLTQLEATNELGITRLSARIFKLRSAGYDIVTNYKCVKNRFGENCVIGEYRLCQN